MTTPRRNLIFFSFIILHTCFHAQTDTTSHADTLKYYFDDVVITGTRVYKKIIDIPYSVTRLNKADYKFGKKNAVNDILSNVPGLFLQSRYGNHDVRISIRGFGSRSNSGIRGVRILLDNIPESEPDGQTRIEAIDFNSVGAIEIVKGNSSSLYTNAPGGVVNFINDINFPYNYVSTHSEFGSFGLSRNGIKLGVRTNSYGLLGTYTYHNFNGYRAHSQDYWHILNTVVETTPGDGSILQILGYFVNGLIRLPGSLTEEEFDKDPYQASRREIDFDFRRISKKGRLGLRYLRKIGKDNNNELEITVYAALKYFERTSTVYRIINRYGLGSNIRYVNKSRIFDLENEFSVGGDLLYQSGPIEYYQNINGHKGDILRGITDETISNTGFYFQNSFEILNDKFFILLTGRYDKVVFDQKNRILESQNDIRAFEAFTPKAALNYKLTPYVALYSSIGMSFDSPAGNELDNFPISSNPGKLLNPDLKAQRSVNFEIGAKGNLIFPGNIFFKNFVFETTLFNYLIKDEIVPFEVFGDVFYRNAAETERFGIEMGTEVILFNGLRFNLTYAYSDFKYNNYNALIIDIDSAGTISQEEKEFSGNVVPTVPKHNLSLSLSYERSIIEALTGFIKVGVTDISGMYVDDLNSNKTQGYTIINSMIGLDLNIYNFNFLFNVGLNNIFDSVYVGFININSAQRRFYEAGEPVNYFANLNIGYTF